MATASRSTTGPSTPPLPTPGDSGATATATRRRAIAHGDRSLLSDEAIEQRLLDLFRPGVDGRRPGAQRDQPSGELWDEHPVFSEYFDADVGTGLGASHQTGWTAMVAHMVCTPPMGPPATPSNSSPIPADECTQSPNPNQA